MDDENLIDSIESILGYFPGNLNILEEQVDMDLQLEYFEFSKDYRQNILSGKCVPLTENLSDKRNSITSKKKILVQLASRDTVEAYRTIEQYLSDPDTELRDWALLAFQESKMLIQGKLLDENQVLISTGLGGRGLGLRYFIVLVNNFDKSFDEFQQRVIGNEFTFHLKHNESELEEVNFPDNYCTLLALINIRIPVRSVIRAAISECNHYGDFIRPEFILTNVRIMNPEEIKDFVHKQSLQDNR